ncbi:hypothetical protein MKW98_007958 [Papaver atlanticum]|uniref:Methyltransferase n=1 Tax=Papaver atlanticum TaxID=357466 RepID=A0AAD4X9T3_9MAGN|nr:hypothetical protein MKW98_007958 [Papaver atlanticum]
MANSIETIFKEKKYPFLFASFILLLCFTILLISNTRNSISYVPKITDLQSTTTQSIIPSIKSDDEVVSSSTSSSAGGSSSSDDNDDDEEKGDSAEMDWRLCKGSVATDYIPCLDNMKAIKGLKSRRHMEHRERHCPKPNSRCLIPIPKGYKMTLPWPKSRDMIWYDNVPHPKLVEYKKDQNWVRKSGDYLVFPGGGTQFKDGVMNYILFIEKTYPAIKWGTHTRVILDVGCGVASFGGYLLDKNVITMSFAPKDEHEAQIQFALERGIPATLSVIGTQRLTFSDNAFDLIHCARCRVHWDADGGKPLMELNRVLRPGGVFVWSATPVYRDDNERDRNVWKAMVALTESICWKVVAKTVDATGIGLVIYQKPVSNVCYEERKVNDPPLCHQMEKREPSWYTPLGSCLPQLPVVNSGGEYKWPTPWPQRLSSRPASLESSAEEIFYEDSKHWSALVSDVYMGGLAINWSTIRNVMDMNAGYGGFAAALINQPLWVMNIVPIQQPDTLSAIYDRGLIGMYHDWCEPLSTYPRTYDLLHSSYLFGNLTMRCDIVDVTVEMDRILRPGGLVLVQDSLEMINKLSPIFRSLHWKTKLYEDQFLVAKKVLVISNTRNFVSYIPKITDPGISSTSSSGLPDNDDEEKAGSAAGADIDWRLCNGSVATDYIPCLDNMKAIKGLKSRRHMEHRERHCPKPNSRCLIPIPKGYKMRLSWPKSRDMIWYDNVPHPKLVEYKKDQNWVRKSGDYLVFPGGGTQFKEGVMNYINFIEKSYNAIKWGTHTRVILDVGCGVASFGGYLLDKNVITMSFAPKDEHEAQIQFALERGIPATLSVIGTQMLTFSDNAFDLVHCARCRVHWDADGGKPLMELNRVLRPGGVFVWSATPVYRRDNERDLNDWKAMVALTESICWKVVAKAVDSTGIGLVIYQKPVSNVCYEKRKVNDPPLCHQIEKRKPSWYTSLDSCLPQLPAVNSGGKYKWPSPWPQRLSSKPASLEPNAEEIFYEDTKHWSALVSDVYLGGLAINWLSVRNVMDMNAGYGGFAAALIYQPLWVMNIVPIQQPDTLPVIYDRGLIGMYHDWCEPLSTYPRTYDLLHSSYLFGNLTKRCDIVDVAAEMDRILRPGGLVLIQDTLEMINKLGPIFRSLHWETKLYEDQFFVAKKGSWRPTTYDA